MKISCIIFLLITISQNSLASFYAIEGGYGQFSNSALNDAKSSLIGSKTKFSVGIDNNKIPSTLFIQYIDKEGLLHHDDELSEVKLKSITYGLKSNFILTRKNYLVLGYQVINLDFEISHSSNYSKDGIRKNFNLTDGSSDGVFYGIGYNFYQSRTSNIYLEFLHQNISTYNSVFNHLSFGLRFKL